MPQQSSFKFMLTRFFSLCFALSTSVLYLGCATGPTSKMTMVQIEHTRSYEPINSKEFKAEDSNLVLTYTPDIVEAGIGVEFKNKTAKIVKIIWDESTYISPEKTSIGVFHEGVKISDRTASKPPTILAPSSSHIDTVIPVDRVEFSSYGWTYNPLCGVRSLAMHTLDDSKCLNQELGFLFTYEIDGKKNSLVIKYKLASKQPLK